MKKNRFFALIFILVLAIFLMPTAAYPNALATENTDENVLDKDLNADESSEEIEQQDKSPVVKLAVANAIESGDFLYTVNSDGVTATITGYTGDGGSVIIPKTINGYSITIIGNQAFQDCTSITSIILNEGLLSIGSAAFENCNHLESIVIPNTVKTINSSVNFKTFGGCTALKSVVIGNSLETIPDYMFYGCSGLQSVSFGSKVSTISSYAFYGCSKLIINNFSDSYIKSIGVCSFRGCGFTEIEMPITLETIGNQAFQDCTSITSIILNEGLLSIGSAAFENCNHLESIVIPNTVKTINSSVNFKTFGGCTALKSVVIGNSLETIPDYMFYGCSGLQSVSFGSKVSTISSYAFYGCNHIDTLYLPENLNSIGNYCFSNCTLLKNIYFFGNAPESIGTKPFNGIDSSILNLYHMSSSTGWDNSIWSSYNLSIFDENNYIDQNPMIIILSLGDTYNFKGIITQSYGNLCNVSVNITNMETNNSIEYYSVDPGTNFFV